MSTDSSANAPLDGNSAAGLLRELFAVDVTSASITCVGCGTVAEIGRERAYGGTMGAVLRCFRCDAVVMRVVRTPAGCWLDMQGARTLFVPANAWRS